MMSCYERDWGAYSPERDIDLSKETGMNDGSNMSAGRIAAVAAGMIFFLVLELVLTMIAYTALNLYAVGTFGYLVRLSQGVLDVVRSLIVTLLPGAANAAYATLLGELGPKAILLLLLGLVVAALVRALTRAMGLAG